MKVQYLKETAAPYPTELNSDKPQLDTIQFVGSLHTLRLSPSVVRIGKISLIRHRY